MKSISTTSTLIALLCLVAPFHLKAWKQEGHAAVGILAMDFIDDTARKELGSLLGSTSMESVGELCNWPDAVEKQSEWIWAAPQHYVNIPRSANGYDAERDCPDGLCVTEAIKKYADQLGNPQLPQEKRVQAFAWLCHLVGDLHQPLHCGFRDDRGGNSVEVIFNGREMDLHDFWDEQLILDRAVSLEGLLNQLQTPSALLESTVWSPEYVDTWTWESNELAQDQAYPDTKQISPEFAEESWLLIQQQIPLASLRLAQILNAVLGKGNIILERRLPAVDE